MIFLEGTLPIADFYFTMSNTITGRLIGRGTDVGLSTCGGKKQQKQRKTTENLRKTAENLKKNKKQMQIIIRRVSLLIVELI